MHCCIRRPREPLVKEHKFIARSGLRMASEKPPALAVKLLVLNSKKTSLRIFVLLANDLLA